LADRRVAIDSSGRPSQVLKKKLGCGGRTCRRHRHPESSPVAAQTSTGFARQLFQPGHASGIGNRPGRSVLFTRSESKSPGNLTSVLPLCEGAPDSNSKILRNARAKFFTSCTRPAAPERSRISGNRPPARCIEMCELSRTVRSGVRCDVQIDSSKAPAPPGRSPGIGSFETARRVPPSV